MSQASYCTTMRRQAPWFIETAQGSGVIALYDKNPAAISSLLADMRLGGADGVSLSPWLMQGASTNGAGNMFLDWDPAAGRLMPQMEKNFIAVLETIASCDFSWVQVAPQYYAPDPRKVGMQAFAPAWLFTSWLYQQLDSLRIPFLIDCVPEFNDVYPDNPQFQQYVNAMWDNCTLTSAPDGRPCWRYSMSFIPNNWKSIATAFQGNVPAILVPHLYCNEPGLGTLSAALSATRTNLPFRRPWLIGETDTLLFGDESIAAELNSFVVNTGQPIVGLCPWPVKASDPYGVQISVWPPQASPVWSAAGC